MRTFRAYLRDERGQAATEYILVIGLIGGPLIYVPVVALPRESGTGSGLGLEGTGRLVVLAVEWGIVMPEAAAYHRESLRTKAHLYRPETRLQLEALGA